MKLHYTSVLNLLLENEIELAKSYLEDVIKDYEKSNHNVPRSKYDHESNDIFQAIGMDNNESKRDTINIVTEMALADMSKASQMIELIESKPWSTAKKMFIFNIISNAILTNESNNRI